MKTIVAAAIALGLVLGSASAGGAEDVETSNPPIPTAATMRALGARIAAGDQNAFQELQAIDKTLYRDIDYAKERERVVANLVLMKAAFEVLGEAAGRGNDRAFAALKTALGTGHLSSFAPAALGIAAAAGHESALEMLLHYKQWGILLASTVFALQPAAQNNDSRAVEFLVAVLENPADKPLWDAASKGLVGAAVQGNEKAKAALEKYEAATQNRGQP